MEMMVRWRTYLRLSTLRHDPRGPRHFKDEPSRSHNGGGTNVQSIHSETVTGLMSRSTLWLQLCRGGPQSGQAGSSRFDGLSAGGESGGTVCTEGCSGIAKAVSVPDGRLVR